MIMEAELLLEDAVSQTLQSEFQINFFEPEYMDEELGWIEGQTGKKESQLAEDEPTARQPGRSGHYVFYCFCGLCKPMPPE